MSSRLKKRLEYWKSPAVRWLLKKSGAADPETFMREEAEKLIKVLGQDSPPFLPQKFASLRKIRRIEWVEPPNLSELAPIEGGFILRIRNEIRESHSIDDEESWARPFVGRESFSIAHELGHTYFYDIDLPVPSRLVRDSGSLAEERLCDIFASELLMPKERFIKDAQQLLQELGHDTTVLLRLTRSYRSSTRSVARRVHELGVLGNAVIIRWDWMLKPNEPLGSLPKLRIDWAEPATYPYIPRYKLAPEGSIVKRALYEPDALYEKNASIGTIGTLKGIYPVEALCYGKPKRLSNAKRDGALFSDIPPLKPVLSIIWLSAK